MYAISPLNMHREHCSWRADDDLWRDELAIWQRDIDVAIKELPRLEKVLRAQAQSLRQHAASIRLFEQEFAAHERALADFELGQTPIDLVELAQRHPYELEHHRDCRGAHGQLKENQRALMSKWRSLFTALLEISLSKTDSSFKTDGLPIGVHANQIR
jgi:hypothetical protein